MVDEDRLFDDFEQQPFYAQIILTVIDQVPLLAVARLAATVAAVLRSCAVPGSLWGFVVLPETVRLVIGPADEPALEQYVDRVKVHTTERLIAEIRHMDGDTLDAVLRYNPVWGGVHYQVWQPGSHRAVFWSEYKLSNALYELRQAPVAAGLIQDAGDWPYTWAGGDEG